MDWGNFSREPFRRERFRGTINPKVNLIRYADDFIITGSTKELLENEVQPVVAQFLHDRGLQLSPEKTCITPISEGFDFLGQDLRKYNGKLLVKPFKKNTHAFLDKVRHLIRANCAAPQADLIAMLNPIIQGWANYHRHVAAKATFRKMDSEIWRALWRWATRRHPGKGRRGSRNDPSNPLALVLGCSQPILVGAR